MKTVLLAAVLFSSVAYGGRYNVRPSTSPDRVRSPLQVDLTRIGTLAPRGAREVGKSNWTIGCEVLDRDFANFWEYCALVEPLGIKTVRLQAGWAKCEPKPGAFNFGWLDKIVDYLRGQGLEVILETSYGNTIYPGAGGWDLSGGIPTTEEGLRHWDEWIDALSRHFAGRVDYWAMWNEPDNNRKVNTPERVADFNRRTARIIRRNIPDARLQGLSLGGNDPEYFEGCLQALAATGDVDLFETYIYHGYELAPEISYPKVAAKRAVLEKYSSKARLRQGENGCPSELIGKFALANTPWSELTQAKWDMRRMLGDLGHGYESSVYTMSDFRHHGVSIHSPNNKGLVRAPPPRRLHPLAEQQGARPRERQPRDDRHQARLLRRAERRRALRRLRAPRRRGRRPFGHELGYHNRVLRLPQVVRRREEPSALRVLGLRTHLRQVARHDGDV